MNWLFRNYGRKKGISMKDPYEVLGLPHGASEEEVKKGSFMLIPFLISNCETYIHLWYSLHMKHILRRRAPARFITQWY